MNTIPIRPRRLRLHPLLRDMLAQSSLHPRDFVMPLFIRAGKDLRIPVKSMPGVFQLSPDTAVAELKRLQSLGLAAYILFGVTDPAHKDCTGSHAHNPDNEVCQTLTRAKDVGINMLAITDLCFCEYTSHGHCGPISPEGTVDNDATIELLGQQAVLHARHGADVIAPSGMMDNMIAAIRSALDADNKPNTAILSYAVKYASAYYGPFREAAESGVKTQEGGGDRKTYQMDFRRDGRGLAREAIHEATLDVQQGADMVMVKPGLPYLDILHQVAQAVPVPAAVYQVSGEYAMLKAAAANGWVDEKPAVLETMHAFKRAGASFIITYYAPQLAEWLA